MASRLTFDRRDPFTAVSFENSLIFKTGTQRTERPLFVNKVAPCRHACPIGIDIASAVHSVSKGDIDGALRIYLQENPLPGVCGRVCYHPCEARCNRGNFDDPINIRSMERFVADHGKVDISRDVPIQHKEKIAVVGSGPAGLSAAYHLGRRGYGITLFEAAPELGGMLRYGIPSYRLPSGVLDRDIRRILSLGIEVRLETKLGGDIGWNSLKTFDAVFLAFGLQSGKSLPAARGSGKTVLTGLEFLRDPQHQRLMSAREEVLVIGGGNVAIDAARTLLRIRHGRGKGIMLVCPEARDQMPALSEEIEEALEEGITIVNGWAPKKIHSRSVEFFRARVTRDEHSGDVRILHSGKETRRLPASRVILAIGQSPETLPLPPGIKLKGDKPLTDDFGKTSLPLVFAGGDMTGGKAFVADAIASGKMGAFAIACALEGKEVEREIREHQICGGPTFSFQHACENPDDRSVDLKREVSFEEINTLFFSKGRRQLSKKLPSGTRKKSFGEVVRGLIPAMMEREASRCFECGACIDCENCLDFCPDLSIVKNGKSGLYGFNQDYCKGCGVCLVACPRHVVEMVKEAVGEAAGESK